MYHLDKRLVILDLLQLIGEDPKRSGLKDTPLRVVESWKELYSGYGQEDSIQKWMTTFDDIDADEMILLKDIEFYSTCEHHMQPFFGKAHIAYIPQGTIEVNTFEGTTKIKPKVVGISKLARLLEVFARRLTVQERICKQVTDALMEHLQPRGAACVIEAKHLCICSRGVGKQNSVMVTSSLTGCFKTDDKARSEFYSLIGKG